MKPSLASDRRKRSAKWGAAFVTPSLLFFAVFSAYPIIKGITLSFSQASVFGSQFIGFDNFAEFLSDPLFWRGVKNALLFTAYTVPFTALFPLFLALIVARSGEQLHNFLRFAFYIPGLSAGVIIAALWKWLFHPTKGFLNAALGTKIAWLGSNPYAFYSIEAVMLSTAISLPFILYLGRIIMIDNAIFEAALIDGCGWIRASWYISLPLTMPIVGFVVIVTTIGTLQVWQLPFIYTGGGPNYGTTTVVLQIYQNLMFGRWGYASAMGLFLLIVTAGLTVLQKKVFK